MHSLLISVWTPEYLLYMYNPVHFIYVLPHCFSFGLGGLFLWVPMLPTLTPWLCMYLLILTFLFLFSVALLSVTPRTAAHLAPLSMGLSRQEDWSGLPCCSPADLPRDRIPGSSIAGGCFHHLSHQRSPVFLLVVCIVSLFSVFQDHPVYSMPYS